jgi:acyl-CoA synthetase (AMP-forming)/AMP-acid ligase II
MLSHTNIAANTAQTVPELELSERSVHLHHGPLFHVAPAARVFTTTWVGGTHVILARFSPAEVIAEIARTRVTHGTFVPTMFRAILDEIMAALPAARFAQSYGMTELSPVVTVLGWRDHLPERRASGVLRSAGRPALLAEVRVVDTEDKPLPVGEAGEIVARGPMVMLGYWNRPEQTAEALRGGWMHTGDIGYFDAAGYLYVVDRLKDMIISGGENVWSQEVENVLSAHPAVSQCAVLGIPHPHWGEAVHGVATLKPGIAATAQELIDHCRERLAHYKCPRTLEIRTAAMPLSGANKILKAALRAEHLAGTASAVATRL